MIGKLVFMTYLNDVEDGGGTEFKYQGLSIMQNKGCIALNI